MQDIHTIREPLSTGYLSVIILIAILIGILVLVILFFLNKKKTVGKKEMKEKKTEIDFLGIAEKKLLSIKSRISKDNIRNLFVELSFVIKEYLSYRYKINAQEMTASEIYRELKDEDTKKMYQICYKGEFYDKEPVKAELGNALDLAYKVIRKL